MQQVFVVFDVLATCNVSKVNNKLGSSSAVALLHRQRENCLIDAKSKDKNRKATKILLKKIKSEISTEMSRYKN